MPIFEYPLKAASLKDPASAVPIYRKVAQSDEETTRFMDVLAEISVQGVLQPGKYRAITA